MYLRAAKTEAEEAGESTEGMASSISKLREEILSLTGNRVDIQLDENTFKSTFRILKELSMVFDDLSDVSQANLLELIGGKRNANVTAALLNNFELAERAANTAVNSVGSAVEENEKYLESITGKLNQFRSSFEALSEAVIDSDLFGALIDGGTGFLNTLTSLTEQFGVLTTFVPTITALIPVIRSLQGKNTPFLFGIGQDDTIKFGDLNFEQNFKAARGDIEGWTGFVKGLKAGFSDYSAILSNVSEDLNVFTSITEDSKITHKEFIDNIRSSKPVFADYLSSVDSKKATLKGFEQYLASTGRSVKDLAKEMGIVTSIGGTFAKALGSMVLDFGISMAISLLVSAVAKWIDQTVNAAKIQREKMQEARTEYDSTTERAKALSEEIENANLRIRELEAQPNLTFVEEGELQKLKDTTKELREQLLIEQKLAQIKQQETVDEAIETYRTGNYENIDFSEGTIESIINRLNVLNDKSQYGTVEYTEAENLLRAVNFMATNGSDSELSYGQLQTLAAYREFLQRQIDAGLADTDAELAKEYSEIIKSADDRLNQVWDKVKELQEIKTNILLKDEETRTDEENLILDAINANIEEIFSYFDPQKYGEYKEANFNDVWKDADFDSVTKELQRLAQTGELTVETLNGVSYKAFMDEMQKAGFTAEEVYAQIMSLAGKEVPTPVVNATPLEESLKNATDAAFTEIEKLKSGFDIASTAQEEMEKTGSISVSTLNQLKGVTEDYTDYLYEEDGAVKLLIDDWKELLKVQAQQKIDDLKSMIDELEQQRSDLLSQREEYQIKIDTSGANQTENRQQFDNLTIQIEQVNGELAEYSIQLGVAQNELNAATKETQEATKATEKFAKSVDKLAEAESAFKSLHSAVEEFNETGSISASTFRSMLDNGLINYLEFTEQGIRLNTEALEEEENALRREASAQMLAAAVSDMHAFAKGNLAEMSDLARVATERAGIQLDNTGNAAERAGKKMAGAAGSAAALAETMYAIYSKKPLSDGIVDTNALKRGLQSIANVYTEAWNNLSNLSFSTGSSSKSSGGSSAASKATEKVKTELELMQEALEASLDDMEHQIFLWEQKGGMSDAIVEMYRKMQNAVHEQAEAFRDMGMAETDENIESLQEQWWSYENAINDILEEQKDSIAEAFDDWVSDKKFAIEALEVDGASEQEIIRSWREILDRIKDEIKRYEDLGFDIDSDIIQSLTEAAREAEKAIEDTLDSILDKAHEAVDNMQKINDTLINAAKDYAKTGNITVDTLQSIIDMGIEYLAFLREENGLLVINEEKIRNITAARTEQLAVEAALNYVTQLKAALADDNVYELNRLLNATVETTGATWNLVYANLALLNLNSQQFNAALQNINNLRALTQSAITSIHQTTTEANDSIKETIEEIDYDSQLEYYENAQDALDEILDLTMDLIKYENEKQVEALKKQKDLYREIIDAKKKMLDLDRKNNDYNKNVNKKIEEIAELQAEINQLDLDDSREAQAQKAKLMEELAEKQEDLAEYQADYSYDVQVEALDKELEAYEKEKDEEIEILEDAVSSTEKIYRLALERIRTSWDTLYDDIIEMNFEAGNQISDTITEAWGKASQAVQQYGSYLEAVKQVQQEIANIQIAQKQQEELKQQQQQQQNNSIITSPSGDAVLGDTSGFDGAGANAEAGAIKQQLDSYKQQMKENSMAWYTATTQAEKDYYADQNNNIVAQIEAMTRSQMRKDKGYWYLEGESKPFYEIDKDETARRVVAIMKSNAAAWNATPESDVNTRNKLAADNEALAQNVATLLGTPIVKDKGVWYIGTIGGTQLFQKYHSGGIVGGGSIKENEQLALLEKREAVLTEEQKAGLTKIMDFGEWIKERFGTTLDEINRVMSGGLQPIKSKINAASVQEALSKVENHTNLNIDVRVEAPISVSGNLDEQVVANLTNDISDRTIQRINEAFRLNGFTKFTKAPMRP